LAGTPGSGTSADGHPVATGRSDCPDGLVFDAAGLLHVVGPEASNLRLVGADGGVHSLDGRLRDKRRSLGLRAMLQSPDAVAVDRHGLIYVGELTGNRVLRADARGDVHPLRAAGPAPQPVRDPARPALLAVLNDLSVCFADGGTNSVYRVDRDGRTSRLAGTGVPGGRGDGGQAALAQLDDPRDIAVDPVGRLYVSEGAGHRVRRIELDGTVHTVAGTGAPGSTGDGGPATAATVTTPGDLAVGPAGDLFIVDLAAAAVRRVMPDGRIMTLGN